METIQRFCVHALAICALGVSGVYSAPAQAPQPGTRTTEEAFAVPLTVDDAVRIGLERNPQTAAGVAAVASAQANYQSLAKFPPVQLGVTHVQGTSTAPTLSGDTSDTFLDLGEIIDTSGQRRFQAAGARAQRNVAQYQLEETKLSLTQQIRDAYWSLVAARAQTQLAEVNLREVERVHQLIQTQEQAGASPKVDVIRSSVDVANAQQALITAQATERTALTAFNVLLARPPAAPVTLADNLAETSVAPALLGETLDLADLSRVALANRPLMKSAVEQVRVADYSVQQARATRRPDITVDYERSTQQSVHSILLGARFPLFDFGSIRYSVRSAEYTKRQAEAQQRQTEQQILQQVAQAHSDYAQARKLVASYQTDILAPSLKLLDMAKVGYTQGATGILAVIDAETTLRNARTGYITNLLSLYKAHDEILAATGGMIVSNLPRDASTQNRH